MDSTRVIVRLFGGVAGIRYVCGRNKDVVYLTDRQGIMEVRATGDTNKCIGFPRSDVFSFDRQIVVCEGDKPEWGKLEHWVGN